MKTIYGFLIMLFMTMNISGQQYQKDREPVVAGSFYPDNKNELSNLLDQLFEDASALSTYTCTEHERVRAIISPHAGYVFSGAVAASAVASIPSDSEYENIFIIGSSHRVSFPGASVYNEGDYITPLGRARVNISLASQLIKRSKAFTYFKEAHSSEHSLEVQIPLLQHHLNSDLNIVPIVIGTRNKKVCKEIADDLRPYFNNRNLFVISSDFSHYPSFDDAIKIDNLTMESFISGDPDIFLKTLSNNSGMGINGLATSMCGWTSGLVLLHMAEMENNIEYKHLVYQNSGHSRFGDKSGVVGYHGIALIEKNYKEESKSEFSLSKKEQQQLLSIARNSIKSVLDKKSMPEIKTKELAPLLKKELGAFVTLNIDGKLRGCIGRFMPSEPLYKTVTEMARSAAFNDTRFKPLSADEFKDIQIEISVLGPLIKIDDINEIILGKHGVYIKKDFRSGTFLPQVANNRNWTITEFLGYISRDKAGLGWNGWKDAEIYVYEAYVFGEE